MAGKLKNPDKSGNLNEPVRTKQVVEGEYSQNMEAASFFQQGVTRYKKADFAAAAGFFRKALTIDPSIGMAHYLLGNSLFQLGQTEQATQEYRTALSINPNMPEALL